MLNTGLLDRAIAIIDGVKYKAINYHPKKYVRPDRLINPTAKAWVGLESILSDIIEFSKIETKSALEFGVEYGYSTAAIANYFDSVVGVDTFTGDPHAGYHGNILEKTRNNLMGFPNIKLVKSDYKDYILENTDRFDLVHVDIIHTYEDTFQCGLWAAQHSTVTLFHDTQSYKEVKQAVSDIAKKQPRNFTTIENSMGLGFYFEV
ncbi:MAG: class I SAM-dependent methyltransferase [Flammeovirgaceae bacterium]|nr:class I SAM-dependent methyltransferase [Flammeovirgaceae bacterium]